jgi:hypothetical protein
MTTSATAISYAAPSPRVRTPKSVIAGRVISGIISLLLVADASIKFLTIKPVTDSAALLGYSPQAMPIIGTILLACVALYAIPATSVFGALLLTGYLGGAIASQFRIHSPLLGYTLFPAYVAVFVWGGLYLRNPKLRALVAFSR